MIFKDCKLICHRNCSDGSLASILFKIFGGKDISFVSSSSQEVDEAAKEALNQFPGKVFLVDVSVSLETAKLLDSRKYDFILLDHHKTALSLSQFSWCEIEKENKRCGSKMFFDWIKKETYHRYDNGLLKVNLEKLKEYESLINLIDDYDRWIKQYGQQTEDIAFLFMCLGQELFIERFVKFSSIELKSEEKYLLKINERKRQLFIQQKQKEVQIVDKFIQGKSRKVGFVLAYKNQNELAEAIYTNFDVDLVVMVGNRISFRAPERSDVDCEKISKKFNGGGHLGSSGCSLSDIIGKELLEIVKEKI